MPHDDRDPDGQPAHVASLLRGLSILRCFRSGEELLGNAQIAERCALAKSTVSRLTGSLVGAGYLDRDLASGRYRLGLEALKIGGASLLRLKIRETARPFLLEASKETGLQIALGMQDGVSMVYLETVRPESVVQIRLDVGSRIAMVNSAMGRACLALMADRERANLLAAVRRGFSAADWARVLEGVEQAIASMRTRGCTWSFGDWNPDIYAVAVPVRVGDGLPTFFLNAAGIARRRSTTWFMRVARPALERTARSIVEAYRSAPTDAAER